jgi:hypothetical protein
VKNIGKGTTFSRAVRVPHKNQQRLLAAKRGDFRQFSVERLLRFIVSLDQDVQIVVKPHHDKRNAPALQVF